MAIAFDANLGSFSQNVSGTTIALTTSAAAAVNTRIFVFIHHNSATVKASSLTGGGLTFAKQHEGNNGNFWSTIFAVSAPAGLASSTVLTCTFSAAATNGFIAAASFTGIYGFLGETAAVTQGAGAGWSGSLTVNDASNLVLAWSEADTSTTATSAPTTGTEIHDLVNTGYAAACVSQYRIETTTGSKTIDGTWTGLTGNSEKVTLLAAFREIPIVTKPFRAIPFTKGAGGGM